MKQIMSVLLIVLLLLLTSVALAQGTYDLPWWAAGSGGMSAGGSYVLRDVISRPGAGAAGGGQYTLTGGVWAEGDVARPLSDLFLPMVTR